MQVAVLEHHVSVLRMRILQHLWHIEVRLGKTVKARVSLISFQDDLRHRKRSKIGGDGAADSPQKAPSEFSTAIFKLWSNFDEVVHANIGYVATLRRVMEGNVLAVHAVGIESCLRKDVVMHCRPFPAVR